MPEEEEETAAMSPILDESSLDDDLAVYKFPFCDRCVRRGPRVNRSSTTPSSCGDFSTSRGPGQKIVSYSYFGNSRDRMVDLKYFSQIRSRASEVRSKYGPDWTMRIYYDTDEDDDLGGLAEMCGMWCDLDNLDLCDVRRLPRPFGDLKSLMPIGEEKTHVILRWSLLTQDCVCQTRESVSLSLFFEADILTWRSLLTKGPEEGEEGNQPVRRISLCVSLLSRALCNAHSVTIALLLLFFLHRLW